VSLHQPILPNTLNFSQPPSTMSASSMQASIARNTRDSSKGFLEGKVWTSKYDRSTITRPAGPRPKNALASNEPYWTTQEVSVF
jgi:hypothetical protein